jgi:hypothetical protein
MFHSIRTSRYVVCAVVPALMLAGCHSPAIRLNQKHSQTVSATGPTVLDLVDHLSCEIARTYHQNTTVAADDPAMAESAAQHNERWRQLFVNNFVASIDLTLTVTRTDGFNPSISYILPLTGAGNHIATLVYSGTGQTSGMYNDTLALGFQLNSTADRNVEQDYQIDIRSLIMEFDSKGATGALAFQKYQSEHPQNDIPPSRFPYCLAKLKSGAYSRSVNDPSSLAISGSPLQGNMALFEMIEDGLVALDRSSTYNIYGTAGPTRLGDVIQHPPGGGVQIYGFGGGGGGTGGGSAPVAAGKTSFGSKVDFFITTGANGGPSITTLNWKAGAGSGGGGGGGGGSGGGGGAGSGGGGGGGGGQLLNFSRMTQDSLTVTLGATCNEPVDEIGGPADIKIPATPFKGKTAKDNSSILFDHDVRPGGWHVGMGVTAPTLADNSIIAAISSDGKNVTVSEKAKRDADAVLVEPQGAGGPISVEFKTDSAFKGWVKPGDAHVRFAQDVREQDWYVGALILSDTFPQDTAIASISSDGRLVTFSHPANADVIAGEYELHETVIYSMQVTLPHSLALSAANFRPGVFTTSDPKISSDTLNISVWAPPAPGDSTPQVRQVAVGTLQGMGYVLDSGTYSLRLNVSSGVSGQVVGQVWLKGDGRNYAPIKTDMKSSVIHLPRRLAAGLNDDTVTASYWQSVPSCDVMTALQKQTAIDAIATQNLYQNFFRP